MSPEFGESVFKVLLSIANIYSYSFCDSIYCIWYFIATRWDELNEFIHNAGLKLIFAFNAFQRKNDVWDPTNAELLMNYSSKKHYDIAGWELGNGMTYMSNVKVRCVFSELASDTESNVTRHPA